MTKPHTLTIKLPAEDTIGDRLRRVRMARGLTQNQLGDALGLVRSAIAKVETGTRDLSAQEAANAAKTLGVSVAVLIPGAS